MTKAVQGGILNGSTNNQIINCDDYGLSIVDSAIKGTQKQLCPSRRSRRKLLESTMLLRLPSLPQQSKAKRGNDCRTCDKGRLEADNDLQQRIKVCRKCMVHYALVDSVLNEAADEKTRSAKLKTFTEKSIFG